MKYLKTQKQLNEVSENLNISDVSSSKKSYTRDEVIDIIYKVLRATGGEIKTTMNIKGSFVEFDGKDLENWIERNV
jgi:hypothetical protein